MTWGDQWQSQAHITSPTVFVASLGSHFWRFRRRERINPPDQVILSPALSSDEASLTLTAIAAAANTEYYTAAHPKTYSISSLIINAFHVLRSI